MKVTDEAVERLREMIRSGKVKSGERLPTEDEMAREFGISKGSLRAAIRALVFAGVLRVRQGAGTYVSDLGPESLLEPLAFAIDLVEDETLAEIFELRRLIEPVLTSVAAQRIDDQGIDKLRDCLGRIEEAADLDEFLEANREFDYLVATATGNGVLRSLQRILASPSLRDLIERARSTEGVTESARAAHREIFAAIEAREPEQARAASTMYLTDAERWLRRVLAPRPEQPSR